MPEGNWQAEGKHQPRMRLAGPDPWVGLGRVRVALVVRGGAPLAFGVAPGGQMGAVFRPSVGSVRRSPRTPP